MLGGGGVGGRFTRPYYGLNGKNLPKGIKGILVSHSRYLNGKASTG